MLVTPLGKIIIYFDEVQVPYMLEKIENGRFSDVTTHHIKFDYRSDHQGHRLVCKLENSLLVGSSESGESLESIFFESESPMVRLSIGIDGEFYGYCVVNGKVEATPDFEWKYHGQILNNGIEIDIQNIDESYEYLFSVAWMFNFTDDTAHKTWLMADPDYR